ncbi:hypothetical protein EAS61_40670 [Bradyrhizobium zhanjiangense]|uniref:Uncharacterized protein n=1 Tax=Bradyrhizobium zhanjiangense TaxID=1325107 RepID=A0A4Q0Q6H5_9BRAD|nr:hypothetical protein EAS61_40670 [Bradyrhizobium zhanjiangense]
MRAYLDTACTNSGGGKIDDDVIGVISDYQRDAVANLTLISRSIDDTDETLWFQPREAYDVAFKAHTSLSGRSRLCFVISS